jgi:hypothetical protein
LSLDCVKLLSTDNGVVRSVWTGVAKAAWGAIYAELDEESFGMLGAVLGRAVPITRRLANIYALLDTESVIREAHLHAAAAMWRYCTASARYVFGDALSNPADPGPGQEVSIARRTCNGSSTGPPAG